MVAGVSALRLAQCAELTVNSADIVRHLLYGLLVGQEGYGAAGQPLFAYPVSWPPVPWGGVPYNYPPIALAFFTSVAAISPSVFFAKLALTIVEAVCAWLVTRLTASRWLGLLYWACPVSVWWTSREGQFEGLQNLFVLGALLLLRHQRLGAASVSLALAIQVKVTAVFLLPLFVVLSWRAGRAPALRAGLAGLIALAPTLLAAAHYPVLEQVFGMSAPLRYNPYWWNPLDEAMFGWNPSWMVIGNEVASYGLVAMLLYFVFRATPGERIFFLAPLLWLAFLKGHSNVQFWYLMVFPSMVCAVPDPRARRALLLAWPLLDLRSLLQILFGAFGNIGPDLGKADAMLPYVLPPGL